MKSKILLFITTLFLSFYILMANEAKSGQIQEIKQSVEIFVSPELNELVTGLTATYNSNNPQAFFNIGTISETGINKQPVLDNKIYFITDKSGNRNINSYWNVVVGRDIIVPVMNSSNPFLAEINKRGITQSEFKSLLSSNDNNIWENYFSKRGNSVINIYLLNNAGIIESVSKYVELDAKSISGNLTSTPDELVSKLNSDVFSVGFCRLTDVVDIQNLTLLRNISIIPIDKNANSSIDHMESFYNDLYTFKRAVWIGKYPKQLSEKVYVVANQKPDSESELAFLNWVLNEGQLQLENYGYNSLIKSELNSQLFNLNEPLLTEVEPVKSKNNYAFYIISAIIITIMVYAVVVSGSKNRKSEKLYEGLKDQNGFIHFDPQELVNPRGIYYDNTHTWAFMKKDGKVKIGIDQFILNITGAITRVDMKSPGDLVKKGEVLFSLIQKGKRLNIYSPITGIVAEQNELLTEDSTLINTSPYNQGWVCLIEPENWQNEIKQLSMADKYNNWLNNEYIKLKDFINEYIGQLNPKLANVVLQDGGLIRKNILFDLDPKAWEEFQTKFIDTF